MNSEAFLADSMRYFRGAYDLFCKFGGPSVYFHEECLRARQADFLSKHRLHSTAA